ncbi:carbohydrate ABC transporter permease [Aestuariivirga sp.]|uniref:carbohydrate ABC transporter permease n=1 Tax=Aestuariivirga sp. TaxID=2650926 RepID=UPI00359489A1
MTDAVLATSSIRTTARRRSPFRRKAFPYLLLAPAVIYLLGITLWPAIYAIKRSLQTGKFKLEWVGLQNYRELLVDNAFWTSIWNTLLLGSITLAIEFVIAMGLAALVYRSGWARGWRIVFTLPMLFMPSAVSYLWKLLFNDGRVIADLINRIGFDVGNIDWMGNVFNARLVLVVADVWQWTPFLFIIFVAGLQGQDKEIEEAARLDGASWTKLFFNISLPMMRPVIAIALVLRGVDILSNFAGVHIITQGTPGGATETVSYFIYRTAFKSFEQGYASAASVIVLVATIILAQLLLRRFFKSGTDA